MSEWITDRLPTEEDAPTGRILAMWCGEMVTNTWTGVQRGDPWMPLPAPYVKPKRWKVVWNNDGGYWMLTDGFNLAGMRFMHWDNKDAAQRICDIYNEVMP